MIKRSFWHNIIKSLWKKRSVIWLAGVRRSGKTYLCQSLSDVEYFDCELARNRRLLEDSETFLNKLQNKTVVLDEIHRLQNPSELLKIASDYFPNIKIIATGSSMLSSTTKFKDTLTGRKHTLWLTPMISNDLIDFNNTSLEHRLLLGGLPPSFILQKPDEYFFEEWMNDYWAKDIQELFRLEKKDSFQKFTELLFMQSGGIFEASKFSQVCEVSRGTITNYLKVLESTFVVHIIKPFHTHLATEIVSAPKVYSFDTGFVSYYKRWEKLRSEDLGILWEHYVLNELYAHLQTKKVFFWRDKQKHEIDFILSSRGSNPITIECKWKSDYFNPSNLMIFRGKYPKGENYVVSQDIIKPYSKVFSNIEVNFVNLKTLITKVSGYR